ncbi:carboxymethylenebutenolidase [Oxalobacteraceae bacterium GrIS 2.11]
MRHFQSEFDSLVGIQEKPMERRDFIKSAVGLGFAAAAMPICAKTVIKTDGEGLNEGEFTLDIGGQPVPVYMAAPKGKSNLPVVLVISEIFGLHEHIADVARRFAKLGFLAVAPELFIRQGEPANYDNIAQLMKKVVSKVPDEQVLGDLDAVVAWTKRNGGDANKIAIAGFCWGGRFTWLYAAHNPEVKAAAAWYGRLVPDGAPTALSPHNPIDIAPTLTVPVLGLYGGKDPGISAASIQQMKDALAKGSSKSEIVVYPKSGHAFHADYRPTYVQDDAKDSWKRCIDWFHAHGVE